MFFSSFLLLCYLLFPLPDALPQAPSWLDFDQRKATYSSEDYFTGFGESRLVKAESYEDNLEAASSFAKQDLAESVKVTVESFSAHEIKETNEGFRESYQQAVNSFSTITLPGIEEETWYDKKSKTAYAFVWVSKEQLSGYFRDLLESDARQLEVKLKEAARLDTIGEKQKSLETYQTCFPLLRRMEESVTMLLTIGVRPDGRMPSSWEEEISRAISGISNNDNLSLDELCQLLAGNLKLQLTASGNHPSAPPPIRIYPLTWEDTKMASQLSARMGKMLETNLVQNGIRVTATGSEAKSDPWVLRGTLWDDGDVIKCMLTIRDLQSGEIMGGTEGKIRKERLNESGYKWEPENLPQALARKEMLDQDQVIGGGLRLDAWTNKGDEALVFEEGERMTLFVKVNQPCYVRFIYYLNDGTKTLLTDDYYIDSGMVNKLVELPGSSECAAPFGVEMLQVIAQTQPLPPLSTREVDGYQYILDTDKELLQKTRGFKRKNDQELYAEKRLIITTLP